MRKNIRINLDGGGGLYYNRYKEGFIARLRCDFMIIDDIKSNFEKTVYMHTHIDHGRIKILFDKLIYLVHCLEKTNETPEYILITPFYENPKVTEIHTEFELVEYELCIECARNVTEESQKNFMEKYTHSRSSSPENQYFLCECGDTRYFNDCLNKYLVYIAKSIPAIHEDMAKAIGNDKSIFPFGYIGFEVFCD